MGTVKRAIKYILPIVVLWTLPVLFFCFQFSQQFNAHVHRNLFAHALVWLLGVAAIFTIGMCISSAMEKREYAEKALKDNHDKLAEMVKDRTLELKHKNEELTRENELQEQIRQELESINRRYSTLVNNLNTGVFRNTPGLHGRFLMANNALAKMHGFDSPEEVIGKEVSMLYANPLHRETVSNELLANGCIKDKEVLLVRRDGSIFWASVTASAVHDEDGNVRYFDGMIEDISEKKKAAEQITIYEKFLEASGQGLGMASLEGIRLYANPKLCELTGFAKEELEGQVFLDKYPEVMREKMENEVLPNVMAAGQWSGEMQIKNRNGTRIPTIENYFLIKDENGRPLCIANVVTDITERKRIERELAESSERFRSITESANDGIIVMDSDGGVSFWNPAAEKIFGYTQDEVMRQELHKLIAPERYREAYRKGLRMFRKTGEGTAVGKTLELAGRRKNGEEFPMELSLSVLHVDGRYGAVGIIRDITDRKQMEETNSHLASIVENSQDAIIGKDLYCNVVSWNKAAERMFGYTAEESIGRHISFLTQEEFHQQCEDLINRVKSGDDVENFEIEFIKKDGSYIDVAIKLSPIKDGNGEIKGISMIARDISERKKIERMKNDFISTVSHELRTPLTSLRGSLGLLAGGVMGDLPGEASEMIEIAGNNTERLVRLINDILDLQKMENGRIEIKIEDISLLEIVERSIGEMASLAVEKGVSIVHNVADCKIRGDFDRLLQVTDNLLSNAVKFSGEGSEVKVSASRDKGMVTVSVTDHGPGIPESFRNRIFQKFQQADASSRKEKGGTGLGLAICKTIVENLGGQIWFESEAGKGTTFSFTVKCADDAPAEPVMYAGIEEVGGILAGNGFRDTSRGKVILVIDDDEGVQRLLKKIFEDEGYQIVFAMDSINGIAAANSKKPDVIILDVCLPDASGFDVLKTLKDERATRDIPVIMLSGVGPDYYSKVSSPPVFDWLTKPVDINRLMDCIKSVTRRPGPSRVLVVDDDPGLLKLMKVSLECRGVDVETAENGAEGFRKTREFEPDLIILDVLMPGTDGFFLTEQMRRNHAYFRIPVVVYTAKDLTPAEKKRLSGYMTEFFTKLDIDEAEFSGKILKMMDGLLEPTAVI